MSSLAYALAALLFACEAGVAWLALHPEVPPAYRAYFLDQTTTCLDEPVSGAYELGRIVSFRPDGMDQALPLRVCGWDGPVGNGTHSVGTSARLRFAYRGQPAALDLLLDLVAVTRDGEPMPQTIDVLVGDQPIATIEVGAAAPERFELPIPPHLLAAAAGRLEVTLAFRNPVRMSPSEPDTRLRAIKLLAAGLLPRVQPNG